MAGVKLQTKNADKILYGIKFPWDDKAAQIQMLGLQATSSTTNTRASSAIKLKQGVVHTSGSRTETFVVDSYWIIGDKIHDGLKKVVEKDVAVGIWRMDFNEAKLDANGNVKSVPAEFGMAKPNGLPETEAVNNLLHANITYNIDGNTQDGVLDVSEIDPQLLVDGLKMFDFAHNTDIGTSSKIDNDNSIKPQFGK
ncbi:phage tail protein [Lactiplantibacillus plantarum]|uniref:phage tail protein n=1 Tax=Lactiplantibacillus plantarum TaxID=1590 RepID=UPI0006AD6B0F|nr:phage tail protein [Lactiplantibacillus plantarum]ALC08682.1 prophage P1 protein 47, major tail protein 2 family [Lactiplantibacillus plantarum]AUV71604.1 phage tail protein [Lactiplantibacillus plantarum subsp. plantarum]AVE82337.1 phage tail protein [Lactiplantibacillus plantarum]AXH04315.1 phage tail protein [Lactiplantibacillus plantarum]KYK01934.1 phage tail protein [Lactiplantibacillus plantarum]